MQALNIKGEFTLAQFNKAMKNTYGDRVLLNADYYSFFVNLCQKQRYEKGYIYDNELPVSFAIIMDNDSKVKIGAHCEISNVHFRKEDDDGKQES